MGEEELFALLKSKSAKCGRPVLDREIVTQIHNAYEHAWSPRYPTTFKHKIRLPFNHPPVPRLSPWPRADLEKIGRIVATGGGLYDLFECSPLRYDDKESHAEEIIDHLFPGDPLLCVGQSTTCFVTRRREILRGHLARLPLIVPNPMLGVFGNTKVAKRKSQHTLEQTAARVYLVIEFDFSEFARDGKTPSIWAPLVRGWQRSGTRVADACAALHLHLAKHLPLVAVVHSGGKSLHGWYYVFRQPEAGLRVFMDCAVSLGADHATWSRSQFVRLPDGLRENGKRQTTYYLNPAKAVKNE